MCTKLCFYLLLALPASAMANSFFIDRLDSLVNWGFWSILIGSFLGGITATFIKTDVDNRLAKTSFAKLFIGTCLGFFSCLSYIAYYPDTVIMKLALPSFVLGCLGAPIIVFALTWISHPETYTKASNKLNKRLGLEDEQQ